MWEIKNIYTENMFFKEQLMIHEGVNQGSELGCMNRFTDSTPQVRTNV